MKKNTISVNIFRYDPEHDKEPYYQSYTVPWEEGMSAMNALDYIYQYLDSSLAYFDHAGCCLGVCARCSGKVNDKSGLFCQMLISDEATLDPRKKNKVLKDLVTG